MKCMNCGAEWNAPASCSSRIDVCPFCGHSMVPEKTEFSSMDDTLKYICEHFGMETFGNKARLQSLFGDLAPKLRREKTMLRYFLECNGNEIFIHAVSEDQGEALAKIHTVMERMESELLVSHDAVARICRSFWYVIGGKKYDGLPFEPRTEKQIQHPYNASSGPAIHEKIDRNLTGNGLSADPKDLVLRNFDPGCTSPYVFGTKIPKNDVVSIRFLKDWKGFPDGAAHEVIDVSETGNGKVSMWSEPDENGLYRLFFAGREQIYFPEDSSCLFGFVHPQFGFDTTLRFHACKGAEQYQYINLKELVLGDAVNTSQVTKMFGLFAGCKNLATLDLTGFDTSRVTDMNGMFSGCEKLSALDLAGFDTSKVTCMAYTFLECSDLTKLNLAGWNTSRVTHMRFMFNSCSGLMELNLTGWDTPLVTDMLYMFGGCSSLTKLNLEGWDASQVTNMSGMFSDCRNLLELNLAGWDTSRATYMRHMFSDCRNLVKLNLAGWDISRVTDMGWMFSDCRNLVKLNLTGWATTQATYVWDIFRGCCGLSQENLITNDKKLLQEFQARKIG